MLQKNPYTIGEILLKVENVNLSFGNNQILRDINVEIKNIQRPGMRVSHLADDHRRTHQGQRT